MTIHHYPNASKTSGDTVAREVAVREIRDRIYGPTTDVAWYGCKDYWMKEDEVKWLEEQCARKDLER